MYRYTKMAANGITLKPIRMGDIVSQNSKALGKYTVPSKRSPVIENIDMSDMNFPILGNMSPRTPVSVKETLSDKIKEKIRLDTIAGNEKKVEINPWKMTDTQLEETGWVKLNLNSAEEISLHGFSHQNDPFLNEFIAEAPTGMSYEEYINYKTDEATPMVRPVPRYVHRPLGLIRKYVTTPEDDD